MIDLFGHPPATWLPLAFAMTMAGAIFAYAVLDGYDLGVGMIMAAGDRPERDRMILAIAPFWDINEVWLVLGIGVLLVGFPKAHGVILTALYLPTAMMLTGLILRGVAFKFRHQAHDRLQGVWDAAFIAGSALAALAQGYMLGRYLLGFAEGLAAHAFAALSAVGLAVAYVFLGACWLVLKTEGEVRARALRIARVSLVAVGLSLLAVSVATPLASARVFERWLSFPALLMLSPAPLLTVALLVWLRRGLDDFPAEGRDSRPFLGALGLFALGFSGLAYSFYPFVVPERLTIWESAAAPESLAIIFVGLAVTLPVIVGSMIWTYRVFGGKAGDLEY